VSAEITSFAVTDGVAAGHPMVVLVLVRRLNSVTESDSQSLKSAAVIVSFYSKLMLPPSYKDSSNRLSYSSAEISCSANDLSRYKGKRFSLPCL